MNHQKASHLHFLKGQEICQIAFGMYDLQINWGDGGLSCTGRVTYAPNAGGEIVWTEGHPFDAVPVLRLLQQTIEAFDNSSEGELKLRFSNGDRLTVARDDGPEGFTIHQDPKWLILELDFDPVPAEFAGTQVNFEDTKANGSRLVGVPRHV